MLLHTGGDVAWGSDGDAEDSPFLTADGAEWLAERQPALVGIDAVNIDDLADLSRPAHTRLLVAHVLVLEHRTNLAAVPAEWWSTARRTSGLARLGHLAGPRLRPHTGGSPLLRLLEDGLYDPR